MVFSSLTFLLLFLPAVLLVYYVMPRQGKNAVLFLFSLLFYAWGEPIYVCLMVFSTILDYTCGRLVEKYRGKSKQKIGLIVSICVNLGLLFFFKYTDFFIGTINGIFGVSIPQLNLPLPIGISFYTFQTMSYTIDIYRGDARMQKNIISFGAYVSLFPQLIAGPIVRYQDIADQLDARMHSFDIFGNGAKRFVTGLGKKVLLANNIGLLWRTISATEAASLTTVGAWLGIIAFAFQIYFDFSGYANCFAQFCVDDFEETHLIDMRFFRGSVQKYIEENGIDEVLVLYNMNQQYVIHLWEPAAPAFCSFSKPYVGNKLDLLKVASSMQNADPQSETAKAIQEYFNGNHKATHNIAFFNSGAQVKREHSAPFRSPAYC